jgi:hypothetical protein
VNIGRDSARTEWMTNDRFCNKPAASRFAGVERCENVLRYVRVLRQVCAMAAPAWHRHSAGEGARTPNSVQSFAPDNLQSDTHIDSTRMNTSSGGLGL